MLVRIFEVTGFWGGKKWGNGGVPAQGGVRGFPGLKSETWGTQRLWAGYNEKQPQVLRLRCAPLRMTAALMYDSRCGGSVLCWGLIDS
jgi:hypothetical protein